MYSHVNFILEFYGTKDSLNHDGHCAQWDAWSGYFTCLERVFLSLLSVNISYSNRLLDSGVCFFLLKMSPYQGEDSILKIYCFWTYCIHVVAWENPSRSDILTLKLICISGNYILSAIEIGV